MDFCGKANVLKSENGPDFSIIDCQGSVADPHRGFYFHSGEDTTAIVDGFTIQGGYGPSDGPASRSVGGGIMCDSSSSPSLINNSISGNSARNDGGGIACLNNSNPIISNNTISGNSAGGGGGIRCFQSSPTISNNTIIDNSAQAGGGIFCISNSSPMITGNTIANNTAVGFGGGILCSGFSSPVIINNIIKGNSAIGHSLGGGIFCLNSSNATINNNTIIGNSALTGAGLFSGLNSHPSLENSIIAFNSGGEAVWCDDNSGFSLTCCDIFGNEGGDWVGCIADQANINGNFSADPLFCDTAAGDLHIDGFSPCAAPFSPCGSLVGALDVGCNSFACGDLNDDDTVSFADVEALIDFYFRSVPLPVPLKVADVNCSEHIDLVDIVYLIYFVKGAIPELCCLNTPAPPDRQRIYTEQVDIK
ncbi:MAG: right-handed parallel beta-helix repeat-containing protein [candidate division Zixibacteria bacterium]|nr:right-handed parallel beta-helix repeat-containing protein [candidate division Zixibacteria bacterium]